MVMDLNHGAQTMSKIMIYHKPDAQGGNIENVWGIKLRVRTIDTTDKEAVESAKADGWSKVPQEVIDGLKLERQNSAMQAVVGGNSVTAQLEAELEEAKGVINEKIERIAELESIIADLESKLAIYEETKDANGDGKVSYDEMTRDELKALLTQREHEFNERDSKDALVQHAKDSEPTDSE